MGWVDELSGDERDRLERRSFPGWVEPMLATLTDERFSDERWVFERKLDGERVLAYCNGSPVRLRSRNRRELGNTYPEVVEALTGGPSCVLDGEVVAFDGAVTSFSRLQGRMQVQDPDAVRRTGIAVSYYVFDLLHLDGYDLRRLPLRSRKRLLRAVLDFDDPIRFCAHRNADGEAYYEEACRKGWEGLIAKRADSPYRGARSRDWLKFKCVAEQELVIGGYTDPKGSRARFGSLLLGYYDDRELVYAGKVGTGFDRSTLESLGDKLESLEQAPVPFARGDLPKKEVHWVRPELVCEVGFTEWTGDGRLRHPRFLGLRNDKSPEDVHRERPS